MNRLFILALVCVIGVILADAALKTALALSLTLGQTEAWMATG